MSARGPQSNEALMNWSFKLTRAAGIDIYVHWTFFLLLAWVAYEYNRAGGSLLVVAEGVAFVLALFGCVVLHELGHALTARRYGVQTRDIVLLPIGGVARMERIPEAPMQEFWVAVAGPAVNIVIAVLLFGLLEGFGRIGEAGNISLVGGPFLARLMWVNVALVVFNMLPAFPMDGGRVLRALLATQMTRLKATRIAVAVGKVMAVGFGLLGVFSGQWMLLLIALFVFTGAKAEVQAVETRALLDGVRVRDVMSTNFRVVEQSDPLSAVVRSAAPRQRDFPVSDAGEIVGLLAYPDLVSALDRGAAELPVGEIMRREYPSADPNEALETAIGRMQLAKSSALLAVSNGDVVGLLSAEMINRWLTATAATPDHPHPATPPALEQS